MSFGKPYILNSNDDDKQKVNKLNDTFRDIWKIFEEINGKISSSSTSTVFGHTSKMPDTNGSNSDHDKRYYKKILINRLHEESLIKSLMTIGM